MTTVIGLRHVSVNFPGSRALDDVTLDIHSGDVMAIVGANGSGKTTLLSVLTGQRRPSEGSVVGQEGAISFAQPRDALARGIVLVPQEPVMATTLTAWENLLLGRRRLIGRASTRAERASAREHVRAALPHVDPDALVASLRKADRAVLALERATMLAPEVLALDEPTAVLGERGVELVDAATRSVRQRGGAVVLVSHRLKDIVRLATRVAVLVDGRLMLDSAMSDVSVEEIVETLAAGRGVAVTGARVERPHGTREGDVVLEVATSRELSGLDIDGLTVRAGEIVGVIGMAGSGRSRLCKLVTGVEGRGRGVLFRGTPLPPSAAACRSAGIAFIPENRMADGLFPALSVARNIEVGDIAHTPLLRVMPHKPSSDRIGKVIADFGIKTPSTDIEVTALSGGNAQRVVIARELMNTPAVLIADEPTQGVDRTGRLAIHALLRDFAARGGAVLLVSSEFEEVQELADRMYVMADGRIVAEAQPGTPYATLISLASGLTSIQQP
jgi:ABC-type sugar transport system ATPase subunit